MSQSRGQGLPNENSKLPNGKFYLVCIGINTYHAPIRQLNNALLDAQTAHKILCRDYQFLEEDSILLTNHQATRSEVQNTLREVLEKASSEDSVFFYFAGHGYLDQFAGVGYWLCADAQHGDTSTYLDNEIIKKYIAASQARHVVGIVDACFASAFFRNTESREELERYFSLPSRSMICSGLEEPVPDGTAGQMSPFAKAILSQLEYNNQSILSLHQWWERSKAGVLANSAQTPRYEALQGMGHQGGCFYFIKKELRKEDWQEQLPNVSVDLDDSFRSSEEPILTAPVKKEVPRRPVDAATQSQVERIDYKIERLQKRLISIANTDISMEMRLEEEINNLKQMKADLLKNE